MIRCDRASAPVLSMLALAVATLAQATDGGEPNARAGLPAVVADASARTPAVGGEPGWRFQSPAVTGRMARANGHLATSASATRQTVDCDTHWDCGSPAACDPFTECDVDLYACVISQKPTAGIRV